MTRRYLVHVPAGEPLKIEAARVAVEAGGTLAFYATRPGDERESLIAVFAPGGFAFMRVAADG